MEQLANQIAGGTVITALTALAGVPMGLVIASIHEKRDEYRKLLQPDGEEHERRAFRPSTRMKDMGRRRDPRDAAQEPG